MAWQNHGKLFNNVLGEKINITLCQQNRPKCNNNSPTTCWRVETKAELSLNEYWTLRIPLQMWSWALWFLSPLIISAPGCWTSSALLSMHVCKSITTSIPSRHWFPPILLFISFIPSLTSFFMPCFLVGFPFLHVSMSFVGSVYTITTHCCSFFISSSCQLPFFTSLWPSHPWTHWNLPHHPVSTKRPCSH